MTDNLPPSAQKVQDALAAKGLGLVVRIMPDSTRTAAQAAEAVGCEVGQIAKSLIFKGKQSGQAYVLIVSGDRQADLAKAGGLVGEKLVKADADFVRAQTGFVIGGVPPLGYPQPLTVLVDESLERFPAIWAAAGTPHAVFALNYDELLTACEGRPADLTSV